MKLIPYKPAVLILLTLLSFQFISCSSIDKKFNEKAWKKKADSGDAKLLYADNKKNGVFFNPWMPMGDASFFAVIKWKLFYKKQDYTKSEEEYLPDALVKAEF